MITQEKFDLMVQRAEVKALKAIRAALEGNGGARTRDRGRGYDRGHPTQATGRDQAGVATRGENPPQNNAPTVSAYPPDTPTPQIN